MFLHDGKVQAFCDSCRTEQSQCDRRDGHSPQNDFYVHLQKILHVCGKIKLNSELLNKPDSLTDAEYKEIKKHSVFGYDMVKKLQYIDKSVSYGVLMHHERVDGSGYPLGLKGDEIHPFAKIIAIADVFDAINSDRGYKNKKTPFEALRIVKEESLGMLDYEYVQVFLEHIISYYMGEEVLLNN